MAESSPRERRVQRYSVTADCTPAATLDLRIWEHVWHISDLWFPTACLGQDNSIMSGDIKVSGFAKTQRISPLRWFVSPKILCVSHEGERVLVNQPRTPSVR